MNGLEDITDAWRSARAVLLGERNAAGHWEGELSSSALSSATAITVFALAGREEDERMIESGLAWLEKTQNEDGGWGDTILSVSNLPTTLLCWSAFGIASRAESKH
ncbi:MAG: squalene--hopene cyclase, partial [Verrucomicrobiales bacterium]